MKHKAKDLLIDLSAALEFRRGSVSGKDKEVEEEHSLRGGSILESMSWMIFIFPLESAKVDNNNEEG